MTGVRGQCHIARSWGSGLTYREHKKAEAKEDTKIAD